MSMRNMASGKSGPAPAYFKIDGEYYDFDLMVLDLR